MPFGVAAYRQGGFTTVAVATAVAPLATLVLVAPLRPVAPDRKESAGMLSVVRKIRVPGLCAALSSVGFGVILSFASLLFADRGWMPVWLAFTSYAVALIAARLLFGHLPDRIGGAKGALICVLVEPASGAQSSIDQACAARASLPCHVARRGLGQYLVVGASRTLSKCAYER